ncbi:hypothetical protein [Stenotrophomonas maltophilia]|uniref:hypothetical protein n=1 Tax=Stenotrophomonas maltophilia TaxID=40324 RepID=UPI000B4E2AE0|nr:hypothetical protein [Stenotrophomonas maltophilia]OWQ58444.1 hypothetical protein CEE59_08265 [Stenotrophomonas maltophilia]PZS90703.1 hypothetical protein A7X74_18085 [Stenotrophomonas maltophilia]
MPIEILIAPAAPAAESAGDFWKYGLPVVSLVVGIILKWLLDLVTDGKREKAAKRERAEERRDLLRARLADSERTNLLALQPLVMQYLRALVLSHDEAAVAARTDGVWSLARAHEGERMARMAKMSMMEIRTRLHDRGLADDLSNIASDLRFSIARDAREALDALNEITLRAVQVVERMGEKIRSLEASELAIVEGNEA